MWSKLVSRLIRGPFVLPIIALLLFALCVAACASTTFAAATPAQRWFHPNVIDIPNDPRNYCCWDTLFTNEVDYSQVLRQIDVFGFYLQPIANDSGGFVERAVPLLRKYGVKVAVEGGYIGGCDIPGAQASAQFELSLVANWTRAGGTIDYLQMDDPFLLLWMNCHLSGPQMDALAIVFMQVWHQALPNTQFGLTVSFPNWTYAGILNYQGTPGPGLDYQNVLWQFVTAVDAAGEHLYFLHADNPYRYLNCNVPGARADCASIDWWGRLAQLEAEAETLGLRFSPIYNSPVNDLAPTADQDYFNEVRAYYNRYALEHTTPAHKVWESWYQEPTHFAPVTQPYSAMWDADQFF